ncbi:MAG: hypothetical protein LBS35_03455 [Synergistaceae bacterium]|nr:hypothetical protein [Synergistaceae bacterium]
MTITCSTTENRVAVESGAAASVTDDARAFDMTGATITLNNANNVPGISLVTTRTIENSTSVTVNTTAATPPGSHPMAVTIRWRDIE